MSDTNYAVKVTGHGLEVVIFTGTREDCNLVKRNQDALNVGGFKVEVVYHK